MDSYARVPGRRAGLRYWAAEMHVDDFRFELTPALALDLPGVERLDRFFATLQQGPVLARIKLIAEPWGLGRGGHPAGTPPTGWAKWSGRYRDSVRRFWCGSPGLVGEFVSRIAGSRPRRFHLPVQPAPGVWEHPLWPWRGSQPRPRKAALHLAAHLLSLLTWRIPA
jgi:hypothetical protein